MYHWHQTDCLTWFKIIKTTGWKFSPPYQKQFRLRGNRFVETMDMFKKRFVKTIKPSYYCNVLIYCRFQLQYGKDFSCHDRRFSSDIDNLEKTSDADQSHAASRARTLSDGSSINTFVPKHEVRTITVHFKLRIYTVFHTIEPQLRRALLYEILCICAI